MTFLLVSWQHPFARTSRSRRRDYFTLVPANAGIASRTSPQSGHPAPQQRTLRCNQRRTAPGGLRKILPDDSRSDAKSP